MVIALVKEIIFAIFTAIVLIPIALAFTWPLPLDGKVKLNLDINNLTLNLDTDKYSNIHDLVLDNQSVGDGVVKLFDILTSSNQSYTIIQDDKSVGETNIFFTDSAAILKNLTLNAFQNASLCIPNSQNKTFYLFMLKLYNQTDYVGEFSYAVNLDYFYNKSMNLDLEKDGEKFGSLNPDFLDVLLSDPIFNEISEYYHGGVRYSNGEALSSGELEVIVGENKFFYEIKNREYGFNLPIKISALEGTTVYFYVNNVRVYEDILEEDGKKNNINFVFPIEGGGNGFSDEDRDGVPDSQDNCPNSDSTIVDEKGCDCNQISCDGGICVNEELVPQCIQTCDDEIKNQDEEGIDCGGTCKPCSETGLQECEDCDKCGCPEGFSCQSNGLCTMPVNLTGRKCKLNDYFYSLDSIDCKGRGDSWIEENKDKHFTLDVSGWPIMKDFAKDETEDRFEQVTVCINTKDIGCVKLDTTCEGHEELDAFKPEAQEIIQEEVDKQVEEATPSWAKSFVDVDVNVDLSQFELDVSYTCDPINITAIDSCKEFINNGPYEQKADILFICDGFEDESEMRDTIAEIIDYNGLNFNTTNEGIFSVEPFKSHKSKFNIWFIGSNQKIRYEQDEFSPQDGARPVFQDIYRIANRCSWYDYIIVLSKFDSYRSHCLLNGGPCRVSLAGEEFPGKIVSHEFGHGFASLEDEYYNYEERKEAEEVVESLYSGLNTGPNCKASQEEAQSAWGGLVGGKIGYFESCGGDCGKECETHIRPTYNSVMRYQWQTCNNENGDYLCQRGPPFDEWYAVNELEVLKELSKYS